MCCRVPLGFVGRSDGRRRFLPGGAVALVGACLLLLGAPRAEPAPAAPSVSRPIVTGAAVQGGRLTVSPPAGDARYAYRWYRCDTMGGRCTILRGATSGHRRLGAGDVGHTLGLVLRATGAPRAGAAYASLIGPIGGAPARLVSRAQPVVSGAAMEGGSVHVDTGRWKPQPASFAYQWLRCDRNGRSCAPIRGATAADHAVLGADIGHTLVAIVQARARADSQAVFSTATATVLPAHGVAGPSPSASPLVAQVLQEGRRLTADVGSWSGAGRLSYAYQGYRCDAAGAHCKAIRGATSPTRMLGTGDVGRTLGFAVRATDATGTTTAHAGLVGPVAPAGAAIVSTGQPVVAGVAGEGQPLQVSSGNWSRTPEGLGYQWHRCNRNGRLCTPIAGATASAYTPAADDAGHRLVAVVRATAAGASQDVFSVATAAVVPVPGPSSSAPPLVGGVALEGRRLRAASGAWSGTGNVTHAYRWYRCDAAGAHCRSIRGATKQTYRQSTRDVGRTVGFAVRATDATGTTTAYTGLVGPVAPAGAAIASTGQPAVTGTVVPGRTIRVSTGDWSRLPTASAYRWQRCNPNGRLCTAIAGATARTYTVAAGDAGHTLVAVVQATAKGASAEAWSTTAVVR